MLCCCRFNLYEPVEFISRHLLDKLEWTQVRDNVAIHVPCSSKKMGIEAAFNAVAQKCSKQITPSEVPCCGEILLFACVHAYTLCNSVALSYVVLSTWYTAANRRQLTSVLVLAACFRVMTFWSCNLGHTLYCLL